jgi:hypothetical protein
MSFDRITVATGVFACLALLLSVPSALCQAESDKAVPDPSKNTEEKKSDVKKIEVRVKVSAKDGKPLPLKVIVEVSGKDKACGALNSKDATEPVDQKGEAVFKLPVCKIAVKVNVPLFVQANKPVDLADYKSPIVLVLEHEQ